MDLANIVQRDWEAVGAADFDTLVADYVEDMKFIMPGQADVLEGREAFRAALDDLADILPPGFEITRLRQIEGDDEVVSIVEWKSAKVILSSGEARSNEEVRRPLNCDVRRHRHECAQR
jgi:ketosteroid isomerase-like protein